MKIDGKTKTCGLIGNPVEHTLSPVIHNTLAEMLGDNLVYVPLRVEKGYLSDAVKGATALNLKGLNVTVPYKSEVIPFLKDIDPLAEKIGAVNTLVTTEGGYKGYNTDITGLLRAMQSEQIQIRDENVLIFGAGGAARAVAYLCASEKAGSIYICNRTIDKAKQVASEVENAFDCKIYAIDLKEVKNLTENSFLAIQCTSVGLYPDCDKVVCEEPSIYKKIHTGVDLIYKPYETRFLQNVKRNGGKVMNGMKMLLYQGINAYELWNNETIDENMANIILQKLKEEMGLHE